MKYWMRYWYRHWDQGQKDPADKDETAAELAPGREQMPPTVAQRLWRDPVGQAGSGARSSAARRLQAILGNRGLQGLGGGRPLPEATRKRLEASLGADLSATRLHHDPAAAQAVNARAFAVGEHIVLGQATDAGNLPLLGHEAAHTLQTRAHPSAPEISKPGGASEQEAGQAGRAVQTGQAAPIPQGNGPLPALQRMDGKGNSAPTDALVRREAVRIMLFMQYQQQGGQGAFTLTPALQNELQRLIPGLTVAAIGAMWTPEPASPMEAFQRLVNAGHLSLFTAPSAPEPLAEAEPEPLAEQQPTSRVSVFGPGGPGFHVTINPQAPAPVSAAIRQQLASRGIPLSYREIQALLAGREQGIEQIDQVLRTIAPQLGRKDRIQLARTIADTLLSRSIQGQLQREMPTALEEELRRQGQMEQALGVPPRAQGSMPELLRLIPVGVSLTIRF